jgi:F0F1-type ATP synthase assembly protein I
MNAPNGHDNSNVKSLEEARQRAAEKAKAEKRAARGQQAASVRDWIIGGLVLAMALGYFASFFVEAPGLGGAGQ